MGPNGPLLLLLPLLAVVSSAELVDLPEIWDDAMDLSGGLECTIRLVAVQDGSSSANDPLIEGFAKCDGDVKLDNTTRLSKLKAVSLLEVGRTLIPSSSPGGFSYLLKLQFEI